MITCRQASLLVSKSLDAVLTSAERAALDEHARHCPRCVHEARKLEEIHRACREWADESLSDAGRAVLPADCRQRLQARLAAALQG